MHRVDDLIQNDTVDAQPDIVYKSQHTVTLTMKTFHPDGFNPNKRYPCVIIINGGCGPSIRLPQNYVKQVDSWCTLLSGHNFIATYFYWRYKHPDDIQDAVQYICKNGKKLSIDETRLCVITFSRGVETGIKQLLLLKPKTIKRIVAYYGKLPSELNDHNEIPSLFVAMAENDNYFDKNCNDGIITALRRKKATVALHVHETGNHFFDMENDDPRTGEIIRKTIDFITSAFK